MARLYRVILQVGDLSAAVRFYSAVLGIGGKKVSSGRHYFDCGGTILVCYDPIADRDKTPAQANPDHIYFAVPDLEAVLARVREAGGVIVEAIALQPWGERS